ncbi:hypothetical protein M885DRAFT_529570 [Pelagophyceae sp. CCMP2097]|nr:hypothetical protein M885DRAFT_529570 [Pelagophyceae sp. CCMP2097]|mmetsp:Transcript_4348/g.13666  ORF Transcript_4348/g.13666 Transcript_4348/m.13666 type:complete len:321 (-) Transcript_4348:243-1205(-)
MAEFGGSTLPAPGDESERFLASHQCRLRFGSSLSLMALVAEALNESDDFGDVDPTADWEAWAARRPEFSLFYVALLDPDEFGAEAVLGVLRAVLDRQEPRARVVIDYVTTRYDKRGQGLAGAAVNFVQEVADAQAANVYVLALEESCVYWMSKGFCLEEGANLNARLNIFDDTHLLRRAQDPLDAGEASDLDLELESGSDDGSEDDSDSGSEEDQGMREALNDSLLESLLVKAKAHADSAEMKRRLVKLVQNVVDYPHEKKYRRLRCSNAAVKTYLLPFLPWLKAAMDFDRDETDLDWLETDASVAQCRTALAAILRAWP